MKVSFILSALASTALAAPLSLPGLEKLPALSNLGDLLTNKLPAVSNAGDLNNVLGGKLGDLGCDSGLPLEDLLGGLKDLLGNLGGSATTPEAPTPSTPTAPGVGSGKILQDLAPELNDILVVTGPNVKTLLIKLSPEVTALVSGLGLPGLGVPLGGVVASASSVGDLVTALGPQVEGLVTVVAQGVGALLIELSPPVAALVSGLGLPGVGVPLGTVLATVGGDL